MTERFRVIENRKTTFFRDGEQKSSLCSLSFYAEIYVLWRREREKRSPQMFSLKIALKHGLATSPSVKAIHFPQRSLRSDCSESGAGSICRQ